MATLSSIQHIDFAELYRRQVIASGRRPKTAEDWDKRAAAVNARDIDSDYAKDFIARIPLAGAKTVLDVGCGPGTLSLLLAERVETVYAVDHSATMLTYLKRNASERRRDNIQVFQYAWDDDWEGVPVSDILIASRSSMVGDMAKLIDKVNRYARTVCLTHQVSHVADRQIAALLAKDTVPFPDYIHIVNQLYQRDIHPRLDYLTAPHRYSRCRTPEEFLDSLDTPRAHLNDTQRERLLHWYETSPARHEPSRWAFITWQTPL